MSTERTDWLEAGQCQSHDQNCKELILLIILSGYPYN